MDMPRYRFLIFKFYLDFLKGVQNSIELTAEDYLITNAMGNCEVYLAGIKMALTPVRDL
jgi:hypothetical protein